MSPKEIEEALDIVTKDTDDFGNALNHLKEQKSKIKMNVADEQVLVVSYSVSLRQCEG